MISSNWAKLGLLSFFLCLSAALLSRPAASSDELIGGQICQPMNLDIALKGLQWRSEGALNNRDDNLWVVCPVGHGIYYERIDVGVRLVNFGNSGVRIQCLWKVTDLSGDTVRSRNQSILIDAGSTDQMFVEDMLVDFGAISVSCNLPSQTGVLFLGSESY